MEENGCMSKCNRPKDYKNEGRATGKPINISYSKAPVNSCWENTTGQANFGDGEDLLGEFPWPPRCYTCTFCKREFRSAQALGGHMNVHRREKAKLRQITFLPTRLNLDQNPNPNPKLSTTFASSSFPSMFRPFPYSSMPPHLISTPPSSVHTYSSSLAFSGPRFDKLCPSDNAKFTAMISQKSNITVDGFDVFSYEKECLIVKKSENSLLVDSKFNDLDLELRLGCS